MYRIFLFCCLILTAVPAYAQMEAYSALYEVDIDEEIPMVWRLKQEREKAVSRYYWGYDFNWRIPTVFKTDFRQNIKNFGTIEKRLNNPDEESLLRDLKRLPPSVYPYFGPVLHTIRGLSGKILDLPGIKGTKHKFPERIAGVMQDIPDIEFLSPELYIYLSPQLWGEDLQALEFPQIAADQKPEDFPDMRINPEFIRKIKAAVKASDYGAGKKGPPPQPGFRHFNPDKNTPLSAVDVAAFIATFDALEEFRRRNDNELRLFMVSPLINYWDEKNGTPKEIAFLRQAVNPCQTIIRKVRWSGLQEEFQQAIGAQGFGLNDWAYTCEKTIKAFRVHNMPQAFVSTLQLLRSGYYYPILDKYAADATEKQQIRYFLEAFGHMYETNLENIKAIKPHNRELRQKLFRLDMHFAGTPIILP